MALNHGKGWRFHSIFVCYNRWDDVYTEYFALRFYITFKKSSHYFKMQGHFRPLFLFLFISVQLKVNKITNDKTRTADLWSTLCATTTAQVHLLLDRKGLQNNLWQYSKPLWQFKWSCPASVTRFCDLVPLWLILKSFANFKGKCRISNFLCRWANFMKCKWPNIEQIIEVIWSLCVQPSHK